MKKLFFFLTYFLLFSASVESSLPAKFDGTLQFDGLRTVATENNEGKERREAWSEIQCGSDVAAVGGGGVAKN